MDLAERLDDLKARNEGSSDEDAKKRFLELLCEGHTISEAGKLAGRSATWFKRRRNPEGANYDKDFTETFERVTAPGGEYKYALVEDVFSAMVKSAKEGNVRAQEKIMAAFSENFSFLRPQITQGPVNVEQLQVFFGELPLEKLMELKQARENARMKELPVIDL